MIEALPHYEKCFFVHYQCDKFNEGESITALNIYSKGEGKEYAGSEAENIKEYAKKINELLNEGLTLVHWNQNSPVFGIEHINKRYKDLTDDNLELEYTNKIDLAKWLFEKYGDKYVPHDRLDNLAKLNGFSGVKEKEDGQRTFASNRLLLITKIYCSAFSNTLKIAANKQANKNVPSKVVIALFCSLINEAGIIKKEVNEIPEIYCERICKIYNLEYADRVRQNFNGNKSKKHYKQLTEHLLPHIDASIKDKIQKHLDNKKNLYG